MKRSRVNNLIVISDLHCGCQMGLCPPASHFDGGGSYRPSKFQAGLWRYWQDFWKKWVPWATHGEPFAVCVNGDALDGVHHGSTSQISQNLADQSRIAMAVLQPVVDACDGRFYMTRGTEAHVGKSAQEEERLARELGAIMDPDTGNCARSVVRLRVGLALCHIMHHIGTTGSAAHEASAVNAEISAEYVEAARWGDEPPDYVIRSHRHRWMAVDLDGRRGYIASIVTPGWQGKTPFAYRIAGARVSQPQFGGVLIRQGDHDHYYLRKVYRIAPPKVEAI